MNIYEKSLEEHKKFRGKLETKSLVSVDSLGDLSWAYSPGVAQPCLEIVKNPDSVYDYTLKSRTVAVISDGSAVLGLGNLGAKPSLPVMEGKCILFKEFGNVDAFPIVIETQDVEEFIRIVKNISGSFGGINLEDISSPRCFEIEERLIEELDIPVMHDDQHGTAIVTLAGLINACRVVKKEIKSLKIVMSGVGAAGIAIAKLLLRYGVENIILVDSRGAIFSGREGMNDEKKLIAEITNLQKTSGSLEDVIVGADVFIGVSAPGILTEEMVASMNANSIIFAMANPIPEIMPEKAHNA